MYVGQARMDRSLGLTFNSYIDVKLFIVYDESIEHKHALHLVLGELISLGRDDRVFIKTQV